MWWLPLVSAGIGMMQANMQNKALAKQQAQQNRINAYSPLLGVAPQAVQANSAGSNVLAGGLGGAYTGYNQMQNYEMNEMMKKIMAQKAAGGAGTNNVVAPGNLYDDYLNIAE